MLTLIRDYLREQKIGHAWHTGKVPKKSAALRSKPSNKELQAPTKHKPS